MWSQRYEDFKKQASLKKIFEKSSDGFINIIFQISVLVEKLKCYLSLVRANVWCILL